MLASIELLLPAARWLRLAAEPFRLMPELMLLYGASYRGVAMAYQINAYFLDGLTLKSEIKHLPTPKVEQKAFFRREGRLVRGVVTDVRSHREESSSTPAEVIDEVDFVEIAVLQHASRPNRPDPRE